MAPPPRRARFAVEDFPGSPSWFQAFLLVLNEFTADVRNALAGGLTRGENLRSVAKPITFETKATIASTFPLQVRHGLAAQPTAVLVGRIECLTNGDAITAAVTVVWEVGGDGEVRLTFVTGLNASRKYRLTLLVEA